MFRGRSHHRFHSDGRLQLPTRFVEALHAAARSGGKPRRPLLFASLTDYYVHLGYIDHKGIVLYPKRPRRRVTPTQKPTAVLTVDKRGRIRLPQPFFEYLGAGKNPVVIVGMIDRIELWPEHTWEAEFAKAKEELNRDASLTMGNQKRSHYTLTSTKHGLDIGVHLGMGSFLFIRTQEVAELSQRMSSN